MRGRWVAAAGAAGGLAWYASESLRHRREQIHGYELCGERLDVGEAGFPRTCEALTGAPVSHGNAVEVFVNGDEIFPAFLETIRSAERTLCLTTYVWWRGDVAEDIADALCQRAKAGVEVNVLIDWMGSVQMDSSLLDDMDGAGVSVARFRPPRPYAVRRLNNRTHRKLLVADGRAGMIGGVGIAKEWTGNAQDPDHWRDTHLRVRGPVVRGLHGAFAENWLEATGRVLLGDDYLPDLEDAGDLVAQVVRSKAGVGDTNVEALFYLAIASAQRRLDLTAAYFAPRPAFTEALLDAARRGVAVRILVPGEHIDKQFVRIAGRQTYDALTEQGVRIWEYCPTMLHAKTLTVDGAWTTVGSVNFDNRSFQLHDEATLCVQDRGMAARMTEIFEADLEQGEEIEHGRWQDRPLRSRLAENVLTLARREL